MPAVCDIPVSRDWPTIRRIFGVVGAVNERDINVYVLVLRPSADVKVWRATLLYPPDALVSVMQKLVAVPSFTQTFRSSGRPDDDAVLDMFKYRSLDVVVSVYIEAWFVITPDAFVIGYSPCQV